MSKFWCDACKRQDSMSVPKTELLVYEQDKDGVVKQKLVDITTMLSPLSALTFSDFTIEQMLKNGITYAALGITDDFRLGHEKDVDDFIKRWDSVAEKNGYIQSMSVSKPVTPSVTPPVTPPVETAK